METINTGFWVRVEDDKITAVWDTMPPIHVESGWREAIEVMPDCTLNREYRTDHYFDLSTTPIKIVYNKASLTPEDRKGGLVSAANQAFQQVVQDETRKQTDEFPETQYDAAVVEAARLVFEARRYAISAAVTHEDLDAL